MLKSKRKKLSFSFSLIAWDAIAVQIGSPKVKGRPNNWWRYGYGLQNVDLSSLQLSLCFCFLVSNKTTLKKADWYIDLKKYIDHKPISPTYAGLKKE